MGFRVDEWGLRAIADEVSLIVTELVTNAVRSVPDSMIRVRFTREVGCVLLAVWDASDAMPVARPLVPDVRPDPMALEPGHEEGGRGLHLVRALASECGACKTEPSGKWVWAKVAAG
ncbi:ATP-binding protein [Actinomadura algeriensis]|uniref:Anti-sigma regulatory factor (Ser/Thr protein kinase) n=1 Tax=Actinomadura algeriensis TaxID=1679523 RepID=A0ABR9JJU6_9ACTN|nr:ATP-binding protein [Actinomadura algeriensis]MBE1530809.1 anti-sigma regulatory factor (Ser/Thr protein kinase) [Actinomadura algeriensis]